MIWMAYDVNQIKLLGCDNSIKFVIEFGLAYFNCMSQCLKIGQFCVKWKQIFYWKSKVSLE